MGRSVKVYAIYNPDEFTEDMVVEACREDPIELKIHNGYDFEWLTNMLKADEVWCFGDCRYLPSLVIAMNRFLDIWQMG